MQSPNSNLFSRNHVILILHLTPSYVKVYGQNNATSEAIVLKRDVVIIVTNQILERLGMTLLYNKYLMATFIAAMTV